MNKNYVIGVDIGGTNTDAVLVDAQDNIAACVKTSTTNDIHKGFRNALENLINNTGVPPDKVKNIFVGTTHATNAILEKQGLSKVGVIRIAGHNPDMLPVAYSWPKDLKELVIAGSATIQGGFECYGEALTPLCKKEAAEAIQKLLNLGMESLAIIGTFSPLNGSQEESVAALASRIAGEDFPISLSNQIGGVGFIERENSTILNAALKAVMDRGFKCLQRAAGEAGFLCKLMLSQNDGSLIDLKRAIEYPILTISAGPTNSFIGAARLMKYESAIVVDVGGTSTDVGFIRNGFPVRSMHISNIGGIPLNFSLPNVISIALGGGSIVEINNQEIAIGPKSVAKELSTQSSAFGGNCLTLTDMGIALGNVKIDGSNPSLIKATQQQAKSAISFAVAKIQKLIALMQGKAADIPILLVGGGASVLGESPYGFKRPSHFDVANAYGAALGEVSGRVDTVVSLTNREKVLNNLYAKAKEKAIKLGADARKLKLVEQEIIPYSYVPNQMARVIIRYAGKRQGTEN